MKGLALKTLGWLEGKVDYADVRVVEGDDEEVSTRNGMVEALGQANSLGIGVRVLVKGRWGFAATSNLERKALQRTAQKALEVASASALVRSLPAGRQGKKTKLAPVPRIKNGHYQTPCQKDPFQVSLSKKIEILLKADRLMRKKKEVKVAQGFFRCFRERKIFASTEGTLINQEILATGGGIEATAVENGEVQNRSYPNSFRGQFQTGGWEIFEKLDLPAQAGRVATEAGVLLTAKNCPTGEFDIILDGPQVALQVHESCGHPTELDRVLGSEISYAGGSFLRPEGLGKFQYGSPIVNITADATLPGGLGTFGFDDEGVPAQRFYLVQNGVHVGYLTSRETAYKMGLTPNGTMRAQSWADLPLIRMTNINLEPGSWKLNDLIAETQKGILMSVNKAWSIDDQRINFQFGCEWGQEIKHGKLGRIFKNPSYTGITPKFWGSCDAICNKDHWQVWGTPNCGKGEPPQTMYVAHGAAPARFRKVQVGMMKGD